MSTMTIAKFADAGGVGVETVRYYQRRGLLNEPPRPGGGIRRYGEDEIRRLRFIRQAQTAGFTLNEIERLLALHATDDRPQVLELACSRIAALDAQITAMQAARDALSRLADDCGSGSAGPCPILKAFDDA
ncbi:MerR family transcriptional regulator [Sphingomonas sp. ZB1N12]|uniref:MerR family transcriptional regulator n=1 Tax=Sphingomonas arabinosi TaxID=3096160 RepID=UPI002FCA9CD2